MTYWTLSDGTTEQSAEAWGIQNLRVDISNQAQDVATFDLDSACDAAAPFAVGATVTIWKARELAPDGVTWSGGTRFFIGRFIGLSRTGGPEDERLVFTIAGPWWYFENLIYQQAWKVWNGAALADVFSSHLFLGQNLQDERLSTKEQIEDIVNFAIDTDTGGAPIALGTVLADTTQKIPVREVKDLTCAECIRTVLRWHPDAVAWWDYTATVPTFHVTARANCEAISFAVGSQPLVSIALTPRHDLVVPFVTLKYERADEDSGVTYLSHSTDSAGDTDEHFGGLTATINLLGFSRTTASAKVVTANVDAADEDWWGAHLKWMSDSRVQSVVINSWSSTANLTTYPTELLEGQIASWMTVEGGGSVVSTRATITAKATITYEDDDGNEYIAVENLAVNCTVCNIPATGVNGYTFTTVTSFVEGETPPTGLATTLFNALSIVQQDGSITITEEECGDTLLAASAPLLGLGCVVNLTGGHADWASMRALVQRVSLDVAAGTTQFTVGPAGHLGPDDLAQLTLVNRNRWTYSAPAIRASGEIAESADVVELGEQVADSDSSASLTQPSKFYVADEYNMGADTNTVQIKTGDVGGHPVALREVDVCVYDPGTSSYVNRKRVFLCSEPYESA